MFVVLIINGVTPVVVRPSAFLHFFDAISDPAPQSEEVFVLDILDIE